MKIAEVLFDRFRDLFSGRRPTARRTLELIRRNSAALRRCGISRQKRQYLMNLASSFVSGQIPTRRLAQMSDQQIIEALTQIRGIGRWSAEMFLMFVLNRPDVLPVDDLGLREAARKAYRLSDRPTAKQLMQLGEKWRPWRTIATWYLWRGTEA